MTPRFCTEQTHEAHTAVMAIRISVFEGFSASTAAVSGYFDLGLMSPECSKCHALHFIQDRNVRSSVSNKVFVNCCSFCKVYFPLLQEPHALLRHRLTAHAPGERKFRKTLREYNNPLSMGSVTAKWVIHGPGTSSYMPTMTLQVRIFHYIGALVPPEGLGQSFLLVYIHDTDFSVQERVRSQRTSVRLRQQLLEGLTALTAEVNPYVRTLQSLWEWAVAENNQKSTEWSCTWAKDQKGSMRDDTMVPRTQNLQRLFPYVRTVK